MHAAVGALEAASGKPPSREARTTAPEAGGAQTARMYMQASVPQNRGGLHTLPDAAGGDAAASDACAAA